VAAEKEGLRTLAYLVALFLPFPGYVTTDQKLAENPRSSSVDAGP